MKYKPKDIRAYVWKYIEPEPNTGCWVCTKVPTSNGYVQFCVNGRIDMAHRVVYELERGPIPEGLDLDHLCRNRSCVNPAHLEPVTRAVNLQRNPLIARSCRKGHPKPAFGDPARRSWCLVCDREAREEALSRWGPVEEIELVAGEPW